MTSGKFYRSPEYREKQRIAQTGTIRPQCAIRGERNGSFGKKDEQAHNWRGGNSRWYCINHYRPLANTLVQQCSLCGTAEKLIVHHVDGNYKNNVLENVQIVCRGCHNVIHKKGKPVKNHFRGVRGKNRVKVVKDGL
jgi:hypothetical protein